jgi:hypothetical protein
LDWFEDDGGFAAGGGSAVAGGCGVGRGAGAGAVDAGALHSAGLLVAQTRIDVPRSSKRSRFQKTTPLGAQIFVEASPV